MRHSKKTAPNQNRFDFWAKMFSLFLIATLNTALVAVGVSYTDLIAEYLPGFAKSYPVIALVFGTTLFSVPVVMGLVALVRARFGYVAAGGIGAVVGNLG